MEYYIGIDLGGTNVAVGVVNDKFEIVGRSSCPTRAFNPAADIADDMARAAGTALESAGLTLENIKWVGVGTPGSVNPHTGEVGLAANLGFHNTPLGKLMHERLLKDVYVENDANCAALGEQLAGAAAGLDSTILVTLGTGVGGGIIINGKIQSGFNFKGGEIGHMGMMYQGEPCTCGKLGCIEAYCSVTALIRITRDAMRQNRDSAMWKIAGGEPDNVNGRTSFDAMRMGDEAAKKVVNQYIDYLAYAVSSLINIFQPQALVIGGGISKEGETLFAPMRERAYPQTFNHDPDNCTKILKAALGNDAGIIGAAMLGKQF